MKINGLILAAGNSSRLGQPKQLIQYQGRSLLTDIETKLLNCCDQIFVVLGYQPKLFKGEINHAQIIENPTWQDGIGSSLVYGSKVATTNCTGLLIALTDQPKITSSHYQQLAKEFTPNPTKIIASAYQKRCGAPAIFPDCFFKELSQVDLRNGAQSVINQHPDQVIKITCEAAADDIDTIEDVIKLNA